ncbi:hypothetical protein LINPERHAP1_LOCUS20514 [Linum perenne]
MIMLIL